MCVCGIRNRLTGKLEELCSDVCVCVCCVCVCVCVVCVCECVCVWIRGKEMNHILSPESL